MSTNLAEKIDPSRIEDVSKMNPFELLNLSESELRGKSLDELREIKAELNNMSESPRKVLLLDFIDDLINGLEK